MGEWLKHTPILSEMVADDLLVLRDRHFDGCGRTSRSALFLCGAGQELKCRETDFGGVRLACAVQLQPYCIGG